MKYIKKILIILFLVVLVSGCKVTYNLKINKDLSVNETVIASENTNRMKSRTNLDVDQSIKYLYDIYKGRTMGDNNYSIVSSGATTEVSVNNSFKNLEDYTNNFRVNIFEEYNDYSDKSNIKLLYSQFNLIDSKATYRPVYDQIDVTIEVPFEVLENNADSVSGDKYMWTIKADAKEHKRIYIAFNGEKPKNTALFKFGKSKFNVGYEYLILGALIVVVGIAVLIIYLRNKKNNRM